MVRAEGGKLADDFLAKKQVAIGWIYRDLSKIAGRDKLRKIIEKEYPRKNKNTISAWVGVIWRFAHEVKADDILVSYDKMNLRYMIGEAIGEYKYIESEGDWPDIWNVKSWSLIDKDKLSPSLQRSLGTPLTVFEVTSYLPELEALMRGEEYQPEEIEEEERLVTSKEIEEVLEQSFRMEKHLQDFLADNWDKTDLGREWELYREEGQLLGKEYETGEIGRIDLLAQSKKGLGWLVIELKRGQTEDATIGQVLRYMGWVKRNLADENTPVKGLIICFEATEKLKYALEILPLGLIELMEYEVSFSLKTPST